MVLLNLLFLLLILEFRLGGHLKISKNIDFFYIHWNIVKHNVEEVVSNLIVIPKSLPLLCQQRGGVIYHGLYLCHSKMFLE